MNTSRRTTTMTFVLTDASQQVAGGNARLPIVAYGIAAAIALAGGWLIGGLILVAFKLALRVGAWHGCIWCVALLSGAAIVWSGLDSGVPTSEVSAQSRVLERRAIAILLSAPGLALSSAAHAESEPGLPSPLDALLGTQQWLNTQPLRPKDLARQSRPRKFLDLHLHQQFEGVAVCPSLGAEIQRSRACGHRRALTGIHFREKGRQY